MMDRFIFEVSRDVAAGRVGRSERAAPVDRVVFEGFGLISSTPVLRRRRIGEELRHSQQAVAADREHRHEEATLIHIRSAHAARPSINRVGPTVTHAWQFSIAC